MTITYIDQPPRMAITWQMLAAAKDAGDELVIAACRRIITAHRIGRDLQPERKADWALVRAFAE